MNRPRWIVAASLAGALTLGGCYVDADGDGIDDNTGQSIPTADAAAGGCDPNGVEAFQPEHCSGGASEPDDTAAFVADPDVPDGWMQTAADHEAGHVVMARALGWRVDTAYLETNGDGGTLVYVDEHDPQGMVALKAAGAVAAGTSQGNEGDEAEIDEILAALPPAERDRVEQAGRAQAAEMVGARSAEVDRVSADLLEDGELG